MIISVLLALLLSLTVGITEEHNDGERDDLMDPKKYIKVYSSCDPTPNSDIHKNNGLYYIKPSDDGPVIPAICSNGYTMIDLSLDTNLKSIPSYLSSWDYSKSDAGYIITNLDDTSTYREWWLPADKSTRFRVAKQCKSCLQATDTTDSSLYDNVVYYTDSAHFCYTTYDGDNPCKDKINKYSCNICDIGIFGEDATDGIENRKYWTQCTALQTSSDTPSWHDPQMRVNRPLIYRPIMSLKRDICTCYQNMHIPLKSHEIAINELPPITMGYNAIQSDLDILNNIDYIDTNIKFVNVHICDEGKGDDCNEEIEKTKQECKHKIYYLAQNNFKYGTYRIRKCGEYIFTEDIIFNFNAPTEQQQNDPNFSPNRIDHDELYWFPTHSQSENDNEYPGLYQFIGSYGLGFFAGITVEVDNVIINLNGHTLSMDKRFYLQQRFFTLIELAAKMFQPNQGPSAWGLKDEFYASNVEIKGPGTLGISSHHGIHSNYGTNINIHDINIKNFDVAGIACNGCTYLNIENVVVGPQNNQIPTLGRYTHSRAFLPRLKYLYDKYGDESIKFYGRNETIVSAICQRMVHQMDMIYHNWINNREYDENDKEWIAAQKLYKNPTGWMDGGSSYGITINGRGAAVVGIGVRTENVNNIHMNNVEIFGIYNKAIEKIKFGLLDSDAWNPTGETFTTRGILFEAMDWLETTDQIEDRSKTQYIGDAYTDVQFAAAKFVDSWYYRNSYWVGQPDIDFVFKGNTEETDYPFLKILPQRDDYFNDPIIRSCGTDIQLHSSKGAIGMMVNGAQDSTFDNIYIHDIYNWADLGMETCGPYTQIHITFEDIDIQFGYTGTRAHGLVIDYVTGDYTNIKVENVESYHGEANGITIYKESDVNLKNIMVNNINAGTKLNDEEVKKLVLPNYIPRACGVDIHDDTEINYIDGDDIDNLLLNNIQGFEICDPFSNDQYDDDQYDKMFSSITVLFGLLMLIVVIVLIYVITKVCQRICLKKDRKKKTTTDLKKMGEKTPLLANDKQSDSMIINNRL